MGDLITGIDFRRHLDKPKPEEAKFPGGIDDLPTIYILDDTIDWTRYVAPEKDPA